MAPEEKVVNWTKLSSSLTSLWPTVPIFILPPGLTVELIELIVVNFEEPIAVPLFTPVISSTIVVPFEFVPVTVNLLPVSSVEQYIVTTALKSLASVNAPSSVIVPEEAGLFEENKLSSSLTYNL